MSQAFYLIFDLSDSTTGTQNLNQSVSQQSR
jgi:hypothetical protein